ncbi:hypothetical protein ACPOL_0459 [Acidisarcina polymorpha]|uniref:Uncharacterized protein n=1 Tax=Acidisarcina polymorpha TaxID=2211140 RepID=A0A2Z5FTK8_9BACT|nr:hypothetical protein ACPOL_0459 [Acidisarcina polymorpha]
MPFHERLLWDASKHTRDAQDQEYRANMQIIVATIISVVHL